MVRKFSLGAVAALMALLLVTPSFADDNHGGKGQVLLITGSAHYSTSCTTASGDGGNIVSGAARGPDGLDGTFTGCVAQTNVYDKECHHVFFDVTLADHDRSNISASGVGTACFNPANPPFYGTFHINGGTGRFMKAAGLPGLLSVQVFGSTSGTFTFAATVMAP